MSVRIVARVLNEDFDRDLLTCAFLTRRREYKGETLTLNGVKKWLLSEHTPVEVVHLMVRITGMSKDSRNQIVRATKRLPRFFVASSRPDITGRPRDPSEPDDMMIVGNPLAFIDLARQRLCGATEDKTREVILLLKKTFMADDNRMIKALGWAMVPDCVYRCGCVQETNCGLFNGATLGPVIHRIDDYNARIR
jgi:hypothetical protein